MNQWVKTGMRQSLILSATIVLTLQTAFAQAKSTSLKTSGNVHAEIRGNLDTYKSRMKTPDSEMENIELLNELLQSDTAIKTEQIAKEESFDSDLCTFDTPQ